MDVIELAKSVNRLTAEVRSLSERIDTQQTVIEALGKHTRAIRTTRIALALILALIVAVGLLYRQVDVNQNEIRQVQSRTSVEVLCPLYTWLALALRLNPAPATATPEQVQLRKAAADTITHGLTTLGCNP